MLGLSPTAASAAPGCDSGIQKRRATRLGREFYKRLPFSLRGNVSNPLSCNCPPDHVGWDGSVVRTAQNVSDEHLVAAFADPQIENLQRGK